MFAHLADQLCAITGFDAMSLQPNSGATGEYAGLMAIRAYHQVPSPTPPAVMCFMRLGCR